MRKLVLGIALVVCLDLSFVLMTAREAEVPELAQAVGPQISAPLIRERLDREPVAVIDTEVLDNGESDWSATRNGRVSRSRSDSPAVRSRNVVKKKVSDPSKDVKRLFPDKVIYVGHPETYESADSKKPTSSARTSSVTETKSGDKSARTKNRSFESKALSVIKKPYKWMRSLASKLGP